MKKISEWIGKYMAVIVLAVAALALFLPKSCLWIETSWINTLLMIVMFGMGLTLKAEDFLLVFKRPQDILLGCAAQFTIMPLLAFCLGKLFGLPTGLMAGVMQGPLTAIFLIAEISGGYQLLVPLILTSAISFGVVRIFEKYSIYTKRIAASGELLTHEADQAVLTLLRTDSLLEKDFMPVRIDATLGELVEAVSSSRRNIFPVVDSHGHFQGYVSLEDIRRDMFRPELYDKKHVYNYMKSAPEYVYAGEPMDSVMRKFEKTGAWNLPVVEEDRTYVGFLSKSQIFSAYREELKDFSQD